MSDRPIPYHERAIPFPCPTPLRRPCRRDEVRALAERRRQLRIELADTEDALLGLLTQLIDGEDETP